MAQSLLQKPLILTPVFNPITMILSETADWDYTTYFIFNYEDDNTFTPYSTYKKYNVRNKDAYRLNLESTLQDFMKVEKPLPYNSKLEYTGLEWCLKYKVYTQPNTTTVFFGDPFWTFNGSFNRKKWIDLTINELIPNSIKTGGRFLSQFTDRLVRYESYGTTDVFNGQLENNFDNLNNSDLAYSDYHNISYENNNSLGSLNNDRLSIQDDDFGRRHLVLLKQSFISGFDAISFASGDVINYQTDVGSDVYAEFGTALDGVYTISSVEEINAGLRFWFIYIQIDNTFPPNSFNDNGTISLVSRRWSCFDRVFESSRLKPESYKLDEPADTINLYRENKKLTFPSYPINIRKSMGLRFKEITFTTLYGSTNYFTFVVDDRFEQEIPFVFGNKIWVNVEQISSNTTAKNPSIFGEHTVLQVDGNRITIGMAYYPIVGVGNLWSPKYYGLVKDTLRTINEATITAVDDGTGELLVNINIKAKYLSGLPDRFLISLKTGGPTFTIPSTYIVENVVKGTIVDGETFITLITRTKVSEIEPELSENQLAEFESTLYDASFCVHHQISDNYGIYQSNIVIPGLDFHYNNPVNDSVDNYKIGLEKVLDCDTIQMLTNDMVK